MISPFVAVMCTNPPSSAALRCADRRRGARARGPLCCLRNPSPPDTDHPFIPRPPPQAPAVLSPCEHDCSRHLLWSLSPQTHVEIVTRQMTLGGGVFGRRCESPVTPASQRGCRGASSFLPPREDTVERWPCSCPPDVFKV